MSLREFRGSFRIGTDSQCQLMGIFPVVEVTLDSAVLGGLQLLFSLFIRVSEFFSIFLLSLVE